jgi:hypothetical protein
MANKLSDKQWQVSKALRDNFIFLFGFLGITDIRLLVQNIAVFSCNELDAPKPNFAESTKIEIGGYLYESQTIVLNFDREYTCILDTFFHEFDHHIQINKNELSDISKAKVWLEIMKSRLYKKKYKERPLSFGIEREATVLALVTSEKIAPFFKDDVLLQAFRNVGILEGLPAKIKKVRTT